MFLEIIFLILFIIWATWICLRKFSLPPGPIGLPFIGYSVFLKSPLFESLDQLRRRYGGLLSFSAFGTNVVYMSDFKLVREALIARKEFSGRTTLFVNGALAENHGISNYDGLMMERKKKLIQNFLKMNDNFDSIIDEEVNHFLKYLRSNSKIHCDSRQFYNKAICNIIWKVVFGYRLNYFDTVAFQNVEKVAINNSRNDMLAFRQLLPNAHVEIVRRSTVIQSFLRLKEVFQRYGNVFNFLKSKMLQHKSESGFDSCVFENDKDRTVKKLDDEEKARLVFELFAAGTDTTILSLQWATLLLALHPEIQDRMREEIHANIIPDYRGRVRVSWNDRNVLRYCQQVVTEVHRYASVTPLALPHRTTRECQLNGCTIPANSMVLIGVYSIHYDPLTWHQPHSFNPSRFNDRSLTDNVLPFSIGKRSCPGAILAQAEVFTILANVVMHFCIRPANPDMSLHDLGIGSSGLTRAPNNHDVIFTPLS